MFNFVVYKILNIITKKYYIGSSKNFKKRKRTHLLNLRKNKHHCYYLQNSFNKHGEENFLFEILYSFDNEIDMANKEYELINSLDNLYNVSKNVGGGDNITNHPKLEEIKNWHRENYKRIKEENNGKHPFQLVDLKGDKNPNWKGGISIERKCLECDRTLTAYKKELCTFCSKSGKRNGFYGKKHSPETIQKIVMKRGKPKNCIKVEIDGVIYDSISEASKVKNIYHSTINYRIKSSNFPNYRKVVE